LDIEPIRNLEEEMASLLLSASFFREIRRRI
jgi:hypothetical protein